MKFLLIKKLNFTDSGDNVILREGQDFDFTYDIQGENEGNRIVVAGVIIMLALLILLSGYLLIYNVMLISVTRDIRFFGMLKTIGTSPSQIRAIVKKQVGHLALIGIPIGILLGTAASFGVVPLTMRMFDIERNSALSSAIDFNPGIYIFTIIFALFTVYVSSNKPAKLAGRVSAIEALRYQGQTNEKIKSHKSTNGGKLYRMAFRNVFRERKRCLLVFASLFMGTMAFLCVNTFISSVSADSFIERYLFHDYVLYGGEEESDEESVNGKTMEDIFREMQTIDGMGMVYANRSASVKLPFDEEIYAPFLAEIAKGDKSNSLQDIIDFYKKNEDTEMTYRAPIVSVDADMLKMYNQKARQKIDIDAFEKGDVCLVGYLSDEEQSEAMLGKRLRLRNNETGKEKEITVGAAPLRGEDYGIICGFFWVVAGAPNVILVSDVVMDGLFPDAEIDCVIADAKQGKEQSVTPAVQQLIKNNPIINGTDIRSVEGAEFKKSMLSLDILGTGISFILILIGMINFVNVMLTGVFTRKQELAVLESVGMTKQQIKKMLVLEGAFYGMITIGLILTIGSLMIYGTGWLSVQTADYAMFHYPVLSVLGIAVVIMTICLIVPLIVFHMISKSTVTERLRETAC